MPDTRPVWLTEHQVIRLIHAGTGFGETIWDIKRQWDAAPADATEAVRECLGGLVRPKYVVGPYTEAVLRALGCPDA